MLGLFLQTLPAILDSFGLLGKEPLDFADDLESLFLDDILVECNFVIFVKHLESFDLLVDFFALLD